MTEQTILVIDDEPDIRELVKDILIDEGYTVEIAHDGQSAAEQLTKITPMLVLLDVWMPDIDGISLLRQWRENNQLQFPVVMMSGHGTVETAVEATRLGAVDFIEKPLSLARMLMTIERALEQWKATPSLSTVTNKTNLVALPEIIGNSPYIKELRRSIERLASTDGNVMITGVNGAGKTTFARHIHRKSNRSEQAFVMVRAEALDDNNAAVDLYGSEYQSVVTTGFLEQANNGVLVINDIAALGEKAQKYLAAALASNQLTRVGGQHDITIDVRVMATTEEDLLNLVKSGNFNEDLYYRINVIQIKTEALHQHKEDIPMLLEYYVNWLHEQESLPYRHFTVGAQNSVRNHAWPGDVRELRNFVQRLMSLGSGTEVLPAEVEKSLEATKLPVEQQGDFLRIPLDLALREARAEFEKAYLVRQLQAVNGRIGELAQRVGMERTHLYRKLRSLGIDSRRSGE